MRVSTVFAAGVLLLLEGCGDGGSGSGGMAGMGGTTATGGTGGATATGGTGGSTATGGAGGATSGGAPLAPTIKTVEKMEGALHVAWTNNTPDCDAVELDRSHDGGAYAQAYKLAGAATSKHDTQAIPPGSYCYKARCLKGADTSPDSNELCGTP